MIMWYNDRSMWPWRDSPGCSFSFCTAHSTEPRDAEALGERDSNKRLYHPLWFFTYYPPGHSRPCTDGFWHMSCSLPLLATVIIIPGDFNIHLDDPFHTPTIPWFHSLGVRRLFLFQIRASTLESSPVAVPDQIFSKSDLQLFNCPLSIHLL